MRKRAFFLVAVALILSAGVITSPLSVEASNAEAYQPIPEDEKVYYEAPAAYHDYLLNRMMSYEHVLIDSYLISSERQRRFEELADKAGPVIAEGLANGTFGTAVREPLISNAMPALPGFIRMTSFNGYMRAFNHTSADFWVNPDGSVNAAMPLRRLSLTEMSFNPETEILLVGPNEDNPFWTVFRTEGLVTVGNGFENVRQTIVGRETYNNSSATVYAVPDTLHDFKRLDDDAIHTFTSNMNEWFGEGWDQQ